MKRTLIVLLAATLFVATAAQAFDWPQLPLWDWITGLDTMTDRDVSVGQ